MGMVSDGPPPCMESQTNKATRLIQSALLSRSTVAHFASL
jgi:hypothetical protein